MLTLTKSTLTTFEAHLKSQEKSEATIKKYLRDLNRLVTFAGETVTGKQTLIAFKESLLTEGLAPASINSMLAAINQFLKFVGMEEWKLRFLKIQHATFTETKKELTKTDYERLVNTAREKGNERLAMLLQTLTATGIRVSELKAITVEALSSGRARIHLKGKLRLILLPKELCRTLKEYCKKRRITAGPIFITRNGKPMDRSNIWKMIKGLSKSARVEKSKVFPHNLRHLFARTFYRKFKDILRLADILGHASIDTTRRYTIKDGSEQQRQIGSLKLVLMEGEHEGGRKCGLAHQERSEKKTIPRGKKSTT